MAVYYKFKSARDYDSIAMDGPFISVGVLKERIFESKHLGRGTDFDLVVTNAQTNEEYLDEAMLIPKNTSVLIRRVPGRPRLPIVTEQDPKVENNNVEVTEPGKSNISGTEPSTMTYSEESEWDEFGNDLYSIPEVLPTQLSNPLPDAQPTNKADEDSKIKALLDTPALDWQRQGSDGFGPGRGFGRGMAGRMGGRGFGRLGVERKTPPQGYVCHRCKVPGHFIQHCPTNGDPNFDIKRVKPPTGIPKSMLMATPDGSYALSSGAVAVLKPNEAAFDKEVEGLPSTRTIGDLPPELHCPLCKEVMKDAVLTSKCCFKSFCDNCIRNYIISKSMCVCGARNILADDLLPNKTLRDTINRILEFGNNSAENDGNSFQVQDMESARCPPPRIPSPTTSAASKGEKQKTASAVQETPDVKEVVEEGQAVSALQSAIEKVQTAKTVDASEATHESLSMKEATSHGSGPVVEEEVQQKLGSGELGKKKKKKKARVLANDLQWKGPQDQLAENYMMPMGPSGFSPYWTGVQPGMDGFMGPYSGSMPYTGYPLGPFDMPFGALVPQDPFGAQGFMLPGVPPYRDFAGFGMGMNVPPPAMSGEEFEARKANLRRKRENERRSEREFSREREHCREACSSVDVSSMKSKPKPVSYSLSSSGDHHHRHQSERLSPEQAARDLEPLPQSSKQKSNHYHEREREDKWSHDWDHDLDYDHLEKDQEHDRDRRRRYHHHHRSESYSKPLLEAARKPISTTTASVAAAVEAAAAADKKLKASVFSRISFPEEEPTNKKSKLSSATEAAGACGSSAHQNKRPLTMSASCGGSGRKKSNSSAAGDYESNDDERHFKRKPSRYEPSPPTAADWEEEPPHHSRGSRDRDREREYERHSKHR